MAFSLEFTRINHSFSLCCDGVANVCTCTNGVAAVATDGSCESDGVEDCTACDDYYALNGQVCDGTYTSVVCLFCVLLLYPVFTCVYLSQAGASLLTVMND